MARPRGVIGLGDSPAVDRVRISTLPDNERALALYRSEGFEEHGLEDGEIAVYRDLSRDAPPP